MKSGSRSLFITGADTGSGKTLLTAHLLHHLRSSGIPGLATKPLCTGPRGDVRLLQRLQPGVLGDDEMNPFWYKLPAAPLIAAKGHRRKPTLAKLSQHLERLQAQADPLLIEGAGGLAVPIGKGFTWEQLFQKRHCPVLIAAQNKLGVLNHVLLTVARLRELGIKKMGICLMNTRQTRGVAENDQVLREFCEDIPVHKLPFLGEKASNLARIRADQKKIKKTLDGILKIL